MRLEINNNMKNDIEPALGIDTGFISHFTRQTAHLKLNGVKFEDDLYRVGLQYTHNIVLSTNHSLKLSAKKQWQENDTRFSSVNISYQSYF